MGGIESGRGEPGLASIARVPRDAPRNTSTDKENIRLRSRLDELVNSDQFADVVFVLRHENADTPCTNEVYGHRALLCAGSDWFRALFTTGVAMQAPAMRAAPLAQGPHLQMVHLPDTQYEAFLVTVRYIYTAQADFESASAFDVLHLACLYQLDNLRDLCVAELVRTISASTCMQLLLEAQLHVTAEWCSCWATLREAATATFRMHFAAQAAAFCVQSFAALDALTVTELLHSKEVFNAGEGARQVFVARCLVPWGRRHHRGATSAWELLAKVAESADLPSEPVLVYDLTRDHHHDLSSTPRESGAAQLRALLASLSLSFHASGFQYDMQFRPNAQDPDFIAMSLRVRLPEHMDARYTSSSWVGVDSNANLPQPWPFLVNFQVRLACQTTGTELFSKTSYALFTEESRMSGNPFFLASGALPEAGPGASLRLEVTLQVNACYSLLFNHVARTFGDIVGTPEFEQAYMLGSAPPSPQFNDTLAQLVKSDHLVVKRELDVLQALLDHHRICKTMLQAASSTPQPQPHAPYHAATSLKSAACALGEAHASGDNADSADEDDANHHCNRDLYHEAECDGVGEEEEDEEEDGHHSCNADAHTGSGWTLGSDLHSDVDDTLEVLLPFVRIRFIPMAQLLELSQTSAALQESKVWRTSLEQLVKAAFSDCSCHASNRSIGMLHGKPRGSYDERVFENASLSTQVMDWLLCQTPTPVNTHPLQPWSKTKDCSRM